MVGFITRWIKSHKYRYRMFHLSRLKELGNAYVVGKYAITITEGLEMGYIDVSRFNELVVYTKVPNAIILLQMVEESVRSAAINDTIEYNGRQLAVEFGDLNVMDWLWRPIQKEGMNLQQFMLRLNRDMEVLYSYPDNSDSRITQAYLERKMRPILQTYMALLDIIETLYIESA